MRRSHLGAWYLGALFILLGAFMSPDIRAATYYVRQSGDDSNTGTLPSTAFKTITKAAKVATNGDTVYVGAGTYADVVDIIGISSGNQPVSFVADVNGVQTGDSGDVEIAATVNVLQSDNVEMDGFKFSGAATRFLVWKDSYDGVVKNCTFSNGDEGLLIKNCSLDLDNCQILNFTRDGIQVDGIANLHLQNSTISGSGEAGIEIRKVANVVLDNCQMTNNSGDGVEVAFAVDSIDDGLDGKGAYTGPAPLAVSDGPTSFGGSSYIFGDFFKRQGFPADPTHVSGSVYTLPGGSLPPIDPGDAETNNNNANIPKTDKNKNAVNGLGEFYLGSGDGVDIPPGTYYFTKMTGKPNSDIRISGPTIVYVTGDVDLKGISNQTNDPNNLQIYVMGADVKITSQAKVYAAIYAPNATVKLRGGSEIQGMVAAGSLDMAGSSKIRTDNAVAELAKSLINMPPSPPPAPLPITNGTLAISSSAFNGNANGVRMVTEQQFNSRFTSFSNNAGWGIRLWGTSQVEDCTINGNGVGGVSLKNMSNADLTIDDNTLANNLQYGLYAEACDLSFTSSTMNDLSISGSPYVVTGVGSVLAFNNLTISGGSSAAVRCYQGTMTATNSTFSGSGYGLSVESSNATLDNCTVSGNSVGLYANANASLLARDTTFTGNSLWGATVYASGAAGASTTFEACTFNNNVGGLTIVNAGDGEVSLTSGTVLRDNTDSGLHFDKCNLTVNDQAGGTAWSTLRNRYGISSYQSTLTLSQVRIQDSTSYSVHCRDSDVTLSGCTVQGNYGIYADTANNSLTVRASRFDAPTNNGWGMVRYAGTVDVKNSIFNGYYGGMYLYSASGLDQATLLNNTLSNVRAYGVYAYRGDVNVQNTILAGSSALYGLVRLGGSTTLTHSHNLLDGFTYPYYGISVGTDEILKKPRFANAAAGDLHLVAGSPAINSGLDLSFQVPTDFDGVSRPQYKVLEIGAYEYPDPNGSVRVIEWKEKK